MAIDLSGTWTVSLTNDEGPVVGPIDLPGCLQAKGYGNKISTTTPWVSGLHDTFWYERKVYDYSQENEVNVPFFCMPPTHFTGKAHYERTFVLPKEDEYTLFMELTKWTTSVFVDEEYVGCDSSLVGPHIVKLGTLKEGTHTIGIEVDNSMILPYRPDSHAVSDALGGSWNGIAGKILIFNAKDESAYFSAKEAYAKEHPSSVIQKDGNVYVDGKPFRFRATHFGGDFPLTGYPETDVSWWKDIYRKIKAWGLNGVRFHSFCPPEAAFLAADEENIKLLVECGMWNVFAPNEDALPVLGFLYEEGKRILREFGHHPSFAFFSSTNEPSGNWYGPLTKWAADMKKYDAKLGYEGRRLVTAQSGWFYDREPSKVEDVDFMYFHRSGYGRYLGGTVRNPKGWNGRDYSTSVEGSKRPVFVHELGQWESYPDFDVIEKYTGYLQPGNYKIFKESARAHGVLPYNKDFVKASQRQAFRFYKEELEANARTPELKGYELLDLHDYTGQGTAVVGFLDPFWDEKGEVKPSEFRNIASDVVIATRLSSYIFRSGEKKVFEIIISAYGDDILEPTLTYGLDDKTLGSFKTELIPSGGNRELGTAEISPKDYSGKNCKHLLWAKLTDKAGNVVSQNSWEVYEFVEKECDFNGKLKVTRDFDEAVKWLEAGERVMLVPKCDELDYECPVAAFKNIYWDGQLNPKWTRSLGMIADDKSHAFDSFPTDSSGGWQWEAFMEAARGFNLSDEGEQHVLARSIDDFNRNLSLALIFETNVLNGKLIVVSSDIYDSDDVTCKALLNSLLEYGRSDFFNPTTTMNVESLLKHRFPVGRMQQLTKSVKTHGGRCENPEYLIHPNPNFCTKIYAVKFPVDIVLHTEECDVDGLVYLPVNADRNYRGFVKDYEVYALINGERKLVKKGSLGGDIVSEKILFDKTVRTNEITFRVLSTIGCTPHRTYVEGKGGFYETMVASDDIIQISELMYITDRPFEAENKRFWTQRPETNDRLVEE